MNKCDSLIRGMVVSMDVERNVFTNGYVAITDGIIVSVGDQQDCDYVGNEDLGGDGHIIIPGLVMFTVIWCKAVCAEWLGAPLLKSAFLAFIIQ